MLRKYFRVFHDRLLPGRCFPEIVLPVLEYCSAVWCSSANAHLKLLDCVVGVPFFNCIWVHFSVTLLIDDLWQ